MKMIRYPNKIRSHLVTIVHLKPFTPKSTSKLRYAMCFMNKLNNYAIMNEKRFCNIYEK